MFSGSAETVLFAIQAGLRLYAAGRKAYVDGTRGRELNLPLPRSEGVDFTSAFTWFSTDEIGQGVAERHGRVRFLLDLDAHDPHHESELTELYLAFRAQLVEDPGAVAAGGANEEELGALLEVRQWAEDEPGAPRTALQQIAGTLINLSVDYFASQPGAVSTQRPEGRALLAFLQAIDDVDFANTPVRDVAGDVLVAVLDSVAENPGLISGGDREQLFLRNVTRSLAESAKTHLGPDAPSQVKLEAASWLNLVARSVIRGGAETVLGNPALFLDADEPESDLILSVGSTLSGLVIGEEKLTFRRLLCAEGLEKLARSSLEAVARNPALLRTKNDGLTRILTELATDLARREGLLSPDLFPDLARSILEKTGDNLDLLWGKRVNDPARHLLLIATKSTLKELTRKPPTGTTWKPSLTREQVLAVTETVLDEVIEQPDWLLRRAEEASPPLTLALGTILDALRGLDERRISSETGVAILRAGVTAIGKRMELLDSLGDEAGTRVISDVLSAVVGSILEAPEESEARWRLARNSAIQHLAEVSFYELARHGVTSAHRESLRAVVESLISGELSLEDFSATLGLRLAEVA